MHHDIPPNCGEPIGRTKNRKCPNRGVVLLPDGRLVCGQHAKMIAEGKR